MTSRAVFVEPVAKLPEGASIGGRHKNRPNFWGDTVRRVAAILLLSLALCMVSGINGSALRAQDTNQVPNATTEVQKPPSMSQEAWDKELERCRIVGQEMARRLSLPAEQLHGLPDIHTTWQECAHYSDPIRNQFQPTRPIYTDPIPPVPPATPSLPPSLTGDPSAGEVNSSDSRRVGPPVPVKLETPSLPFQN